MESFSSSSSSFLSVARPEGKGSRPHVFSLVPNASMRAGPLLDVAANSQEELKEWLYKIREVTVTSEAKVKTAARTQSRLVFGPSYPCI